MTDNDKPMDRRLKAVFEAIEAMTPEERLDAQKRWRARRAEMEMGDEGTRPKLDGAAQ